MNSSARIRLSIIVPAYNEEARLGRMLDAYLDHFSRHYGSEVEILVVVNGSTDATAEIARARMADRPALRVLVDPRPIGKGGAIMAGMRAARGAVVGFVDADGATPPDAFERLVREMGDADCVLANRWHPASHITPQPWRRRAASRVFNALVRLFFRLPISDTQCGAKAMRREMLERILPHLGLTRWAFDVDLLFQVRRAGGVIREAPTVWHDEAGSRLRIVRASLDMFVAICRLRLLYSPFRWIVSLYDVTLGRFIHRPLPPPPASLEIPRAPASAAGQPSTDHERGNSRH